MIIFYTGTGNSRYAAQQLAEITGDELFDATECIRKGEFPTLESQRAWVFVSPIYAWRLPKIFAEWIEKTVFDGNHRAYFLLTCGSDIGNAAHYIKKLCAKKNFELAGVKEIVMPENYVAMFDVPDNETSVRIRKAARRRISRIAADINEEKELAKSKIAITDRIKSSIVNPVFYSACVKSKDFKAGDKCVSCGKCARVCPVSGIIMENGRPVWTGECTHCMACICGCPAEAIEYGKKSVGKVRYICPPYSEEK